MKIQELLKVRDSLQNATGGEPTESELAETTNMSVVDVKRHLAVGRAARNKLIRVSILILFPNFHEFLLIALCFDDF